MTDEQTEPMQADQATDGSLEHRVTLLENGLVELAERSRADHQASTEAVAELEDRVLFSLDQQSKGLSEVAIRLITLENSMTQIAAAATAHLDRIQSIEDRLDALEKPIVGEETPIAEERRESDPDDELRLRQIAGMTTAMETARALGDTAGEQRCLHRILQIDPTWTAPA